MSDNDTLEDEVAALEDAINALEGQATCRDYHAMMRRIDAAADAATHHTNRWHILRRLGEAQEALEATTTIAPPTPSRDDVRSALAAIEDDARNGRNVAGLGGRMMDVLGAIGRGGYMGLMAWAGDVAALVESAQRGLNNERPNP